MSSHHDWVTEIIQRHDLEKPFAPENGKALKFHVGDFVIYTNDYGVAFNRQITGLYQPQKPCSLYASGCRYLLNTDCYWMPVKEANLSTDESLVRSTQPI